MTRRRFLFALLDRASASGGTAVLLDSAQTLASAGYDCAMLHSSPAARLTYTGTASARPRRFFTHDIRRAGLARESWRYRAWQGARMGLESLRGGPAARYRPQTSDVLVVPEFLLGDAQSAYPDLDKVVYVQNPFSYVRGCHQARQAGCDPHARVLLNIASARSCIDALEVAGAEPVAYVPARPDLERYEFAAAKSRKIAYMPRKRAAEAEQLLGALKRRGNLHGWDFVAISGHTQEDVARTMRDSLIFVSLMRDESLGFPAIEAMSAGCITVGYTGFGGREYFDDTTGVPIEEGDTLALIEGLERIAAEYDADPTRLDGLRRAASEKVNAVYTRARFEGALLQAWEELPSG